eukprot:scaffold2344_cov149-Skeletonema_menzelii.AAC.4
MHNIPFEGDLGSRGAGADVGTNLTSRPFFSSDYAIGDDDEDVFSTGDAADAKSFTEQNGNHDNEYASRRLSVEHRNDKNNSDSNLSFKEFRRSLSILKKTIDRMDFLDEEESLLDDDYGSVYSDGSSTSDEDERGGEGCPQSFPSYLQIVQHQSEEDDMDQPSSYALQTSMRARKSITRKTKMPVTEDCSKRRKKKVNWLKSFYRLDPRWQICNFFEDLAYEGVGGIDETGRIRHSGLNLPSIIKAFSRVGVFSVWRPTSNEAIRRMITGEGTGKGMDIKGKSATRGKWSGFVPFLQIHRNEDKLKIGSLHADARVRVFYPNKLSRDRAFMSMSMVRDNMVETSQRSMRFINEVERKEVFALDVEMHKSTRNLTHCSKSKMRNAIGNARRRLTTALDYSKFEQALEAKHHNSMVDAVVYKLDDYANGAHGHGYYGLDIPEKLFWETYVSKTDISREAGSEYDTGRASMPEFQAMNLESLRKAPKSGPRPVLWHAGCGKVGEEPPQNVNPLCPLGLLMAYEEGDNETGKVTPVVSDFDCFLVGTRGVEYRDPLADQELSVLKWCVDEIEGVLDNNKDKGAEGAGWTRQWLDVKKKYAFDPRFQVPVPKMGYADPRSSAMMKGAVYSLRENGAVRHGPECFNYAFPQPLDDKFLVISDTLPGLVPWKYVNVKELKEILADKIDDGFAFPLNPKWILCDEGWKDLYDKLLASEAPNVQDAMNVWYPADVRERIAAISSKHPFGFGSRGAKRGTAERLALMKQKRRHVSRSQIDYDELMTEVAELELERYKDLRNGKMKLRRAFLKVEPKKKTRKHSFFSSALLMLRMGKEADAHAKHAEVSSGEDRGRKKTGIEKLRNKLSIGSSPRERSTSSQTDRTESGRNKIRRRSTLSRRRTVDSEKSSTSSISITSFPSERSLSFQADGKDSQDERSARRRSSFFKTTGRGQASNYIRRRLASEKMEDD